MRSASLELPRHLLRQPIRRCRSGRDDVRLIGRQPAVENHLRARLLRLREEAAIERALLGAAMDEPAVRLLAADHARGVFVVVERGPVGGAEVEVALDAEAVEEVGDGLGFGGAFDDLQIADEARADVALWPREPRLRGRRGRG